MQQAKQVDLNLFNTLGTSLEETIPTERISAKTLAEIIGEAIAGHTKAEWEYDHNTKSLQVTPQTTAAYDTTAVTKTLSPSKLDAVQDVIYPRYQPLSQDRSNTITISFE